MSRIIEFTEVLILDNFVKILSVGERILVNQYRAGKSKDVPPKVKGLQKYIEVEKWQPPQLHYSVDRLLEWLDESEKVWRPMRNYKDYNLEKISYYVRQLEL